MRIDRATRQAELAILNAPFEKGGWHRAAAGIAEATGSSAAHLLGMGGPLLLPLNVFVGDVPGIERYLGDPDFHGESNWRVGSVTLPMEIQHEAHYAAYRLEHDTAEYDDASSDLDIPFGCQCAVLLDSNTLLGIALLRRRRDGPCDAQTLSRFARLRHQLARAVRVQLALDGEAAELMVGEMEPLQGATILLDRLGSLCALTPAAEQLLEDGGPLELDGLAVRLRNRAEDRQLQSALARLLASDGRDQAVVHEARVGRSVNAPRGKWRLIVVRLPQREHGLGFEPHLAVTFRAVT